MSVTERPEQASAALVSQRSRGHLIYRVMARTYGANAAFPGDRPGARRAAFLAGAAVDVVTYAWLRDRDALALGPRLAIDLADAQVFSRGVERSPEAAMMIGVPLAAEAGVRSGPVGFVVPAAHLIVATVLRRRRGLPTPVGSVMPQLQGAAVGAAAGWYTRHVHRQISGEHALETGALAEAANLAGQHEVAMEASSMVDQLSGIEYLLAVGGGQPIGEARSMARWKAALAEGSTTDATYLRVVLSRWESDHRTARLETDLVIDLDEPSGRVVLTRVQADRLTAALEGLAPIGRCRVRAELDDGPRFAGQELVLEVGSYVIGLDADADVGRRLDPAPAMAAGGVGWAMGLSLTAHGGVPVPVTAVSASASVGFAAWLNRALQSPAPPSPSRVVGLAVGLGTLQALAAACTLRTAADPDGVQVFPGAMTLMAPAFLAGRYRHAPGGPTVPALAALFAAALAVTVLPMRDQIDARALGAGAAEVVAGFLLFSRMQGALDEDHARVTAALDAERREGAERAYASGRRRALDLVAEQSTRLGGLLDDGVLDDAVRDEVRRRLDRVAIELEAVR